jgi:hypothetical protein
LKNTLEGEGRVFWDFSKSTENQNDQNLVVWCVLTCYWVVHKFVNFNNLG